MLLTGMISIMFMPQAKAQQYDAVSYMDSVEFSLITCSPHEEIYSLYGHSALRMHDLHQGKEEDAVFNWGIFNFNKPYFVLRFIFGLTDYELGVAGFPGFCEYYRRWGSSVNCSTRPRDMIERCIDGEVVYEPHDDYTPSFREMIYEKTSHHPWVVFGNDMLLGVRADLKTTRQEQEFLPENLLYDIDHARIKGADGSWRPLVKTRNIPVTPGVQVIEHDFPLTPTHCAVILLMVSLTIFLWEWRRRKTCKYWDASIMLLVGLAGCVLFVMLFSQHPTTSTNLQLLLVNPVHLFYLPAVLRRRKTHYWYVLLAMVCLFLIGGIFQHYAEGLLILALCLLLRFWIHLKNEK